MKKITDYEFFKKRSVRIGSAVAAIVLLLIGSVILIWLLSTEMVTANPRFTLRHVLVKSHDRGFWKGQKNLICEIFRIREGSTNLFTLNPKELRKRLLAREPSVESVQVIRELPDTLYVDIVERTPAALVNSRNSPLVIDSKAILMNKNRCMNISASLPIVFGLPNAASYPPGSAIQKFGPAVKLINLTRTSYPDLRIGAINVSHPGQLICAVYYKERKVIYRVVMPDQNLSRNLQILSTTLEKMFKSHNPRRNINLMFKGQVIITDSRIPGGNFHT